MDSHKQIQTLTRMLDDDRKQIERYKKLVEYNLNFYRDKHQLNLWEQRKNYLDEELNLLYRILEARKKQLNVI